MDSNFNLFTHNNSMIMKDTKANINLNLKENNDKDKDTYLIKSCGNDLISFGGKVNNIVPFNDMTAYSDRKILTPTSQELNISNRPKSIISPPISKIDPKSPIYSNLPDDDHYLSDNQHNLNEYNLLALKNPCNNNNPSEDTQISLKLLEMNKEINRLKNENYHVSKLREEYESLKFKLQRDYKDFIKKKEDEQYLFEVFKEEEMKKIQREKKQLAHDQKIFNTIKIKTHTIPSVAKKDKDQIEQLKITMTKMQDEFKLKENNNKLIIEKYKKKLDESSHAIIKLNDQISHMSLIKIPPLNGNLSNNTSQYDIKEMKKNKSQSSINSNRKRNSSFNENINQQLQQKKLQRLQLHQQQQIAKQINSPSSNHKKKKFPSKKHDPLDDEDDIDTFDVVFLDKYHKEPYPLIKQETGADNKIIRYYDHSKKELIFPSGVRKEMYGDGYQIIYFNNGDLKQLYPNGKIVYYYSDAKTIQTTYKDLQVFKFENGQIEKHFKDGTKQIAFLDGSLKYILPNGTEETYYLDGKIEKINNEGIISIEHEDGSKEVHYPARNKISKKS